MPFVAVNHLEAHALTARLPHHRPGGLVAGGAAFPYLLLLISGGHCQLLGVEGVGRYRRLGGTIDDAVGEAFDKVGKMLGLGWPGGPALEHVGGAPAMPGRWRCPGRCWAVPGCDFSFSGLKTAVARLLGSAPARRTSRPPSSASVAEVLADRTAHAMDMMRRLHPHAALLVVAGGVAANAGGARRAGLGCRIRRASGIRHGRTAAAAVRRQRGDGGLGRDRAAAPGP